MARCCKKPGTEEGDGKGAVRVCLNPSCGTPFEPGHYGPAQLVCGGDYEEKCRKCPGEECKKCGGAGTFRQDCRQWYKMYWSRTRKRPRGVRNEDLAAVLREVRDDVPLWSLFVVASWSAMRKGELLGLTWGDVMDGENVRSSFPLRGQWDDREGFKALKTGEGRIAFLLPEARAAMLKYWRWTKARGKPNPFPRRIWEISESGAWAKFVGVQKKLGITNPDTGKPHRFHDLRHQAILQTYRATKDIGKAQVLAGHKSASTTFIYATERPEEFLAIVEGAFERAKPPKGPAPRK